MAGETGQNNFDGRFARELAGIASRLEQAKNLVPHIGDTSIHWVAIEELTVSLGGLIDAHTTRHLDLTLVPEGGAGQTGVEVVQ